MNKRDHLGNRNRNLAKIDMEKVYRLIDEGLTVKQVAEKIGVSPSTLYRHHNKLQKRKMQVNRMDFQNCIIIQYKNMQ